MNYDHIAQAYQNAERQALEEMNDPHLIVLTMFDALLKSMQLFLVVWLISLQFFEAMILFLKEKL